MKTCPLFAEKTMKRPLCWRKPITAIAITLLLSACDRVDQQKFDGVYRAGKALQVDVNTGGGIGPRSHELLNQFQTEIGILQGRRTSDREAAALRAYEAAGDAYANFLRFRLLDLDAVDGLVVLMGTNLDAARKYQLPVQTMAAVLSLTGPDEARFADVRLVDSGVALRTFVERAEASLAEANSLANGKPQ